MAKYHITIKDNITGTIMHDCETSCIVGAFQNDDTGCAGQLIAANCNTVDLAHTTYCAASVVKLVQDKKRGRSVDYQAVGYDETKGGIR